MLKGDPFWGRVVYRAYMDLSDRLKNIIDSFVVGIVQAVANEVGGQSVVRSKGATRIVTSPRVYRARLDAVGDRFNLLVGNRRYTAKRRRDLVRRARQLGCSELIQGNQVTIL